MVKALQTNYPAWNCIIYSGDQNVTPAQIIAKVRSRFGIDLDESRVEFCFLQTRWLLEASCYPYFTMIGQSLGAVVVVLEALERRLPHVFIDSMGYSFTLWVARLLGGCRVGAYVHYPTISTDMLSRVSDGSSSHNNRQSVARNPLLRYGKLFYYRVFALIYGLAGKAAQLVFVNSTWTRNHVVALWGRPQLTQILYPPCNTSNLSNLPFTEKRERGTFISIAQFRPEKDHAKQIRAMALLKQKKDAVLSKARLILIGSCRNQGDQELVDGLRRLASELGVSENVEFQLNVSFDELKSWYSRGQFGIHTMWCEHFGIGVVELMASGVVVVAHNSAGPKMDIVCPMDGQRTGFLAATVEEYAAEMEKMLRLSPEEILEIQEAARRRTTMFSDESFKENFLQGISPMLDSIKNKVE